MPIFFHPVETFVLTRQLFLLIAAAFEEFHERCLEEFRWIDDFDILGSQKHYVDLKSVNFNFFHLILNQKVKRRAFMNTVLLHDLNH